MKTAFNFPPSPETAAKSQLLLEVGPRTLSFLWCDASTKFIEGFVCLICDVIITEKELHLLPGDILALAKQAETHLICFDGPRQVLTPREFHREILVKELLTLIWGFSDSEVDATDQITSCNIVNYYRVARGTKLFFEKHFPGAKNFHSTSLQMEMLRSLDNILFCIFYESSLKLFLFKNSRLQLVQSFPYTSSEDITYHLLNTCSQFEVDSSQIRLRVAGMIEESSGVYAQIARYFKTSEFANYSGQTINHSQLNKLPAHHFSHLTGMIQCAS